MNIKFYIVIFLLIISVITMMGIIFLTYNDKKIINAIIDEEQDDDETKKNQVRFCNKIFNVTYLYLLLGLIIIPIIYYMLEYFNIIDLFINKKTNKINNTILSINIFILVLLYYLLGKINNNYQYLRNIVWLLLIIFLTLITSSSTKLLLSKYKENIILYQLFVLCLIIIILGYFIGSYYGDQLYIFTNKREYIVFNLIIIILSLLMYLSYIYYIDLYNILINVFVFIFLILMLIEYIKYLYELHLKILKCKTDKQIQQYTDYNKMSIDLIISLGNIIYDIPDKFIKIKNEYSTLF